MGGREGTREPGAVPGTEEDAELPGVVEVEGNRSGWVRLLRAIQY